MPKYRVLRGTYRRADGTRAESGDIIEISEDRYDRLPSDSYERVDEDESEQEPEPEPDEEETDEQPEPEPEPDDTGITPEAVLPYDDYTLLSKMAALSDSGDVHGAMSGDEIIDHFEKQPGGHVADLLSEAESEMGDE